MSLENEIEVDFTTDLQGDTVDEAVLTVEATAKLLRELIPKVTGADQRGSNILNDIYDSLAGHNTTSPGLGQYREDTKNGSGSAISANPNRTLAQKIAEILPENMRRSSILKNGDIRAVLQKIMIAPAQGERGDRFSINGVEFTANERAAAGLILVEQTDRILKSFKDHVFSNTADQALAQEVVETFKNEILYDYRDGVMHSSLPIDEARWGTGAYGRDAEGNPIAIGGTPLEGGVEEEINRYADLDDTTGGDQYPFYTEDDVQDLFATTYDQNTTVQQIYQTEAAQEEQAAAMGGRTSGRKVSVQYDDADVTTEYNTPDHLSTTGREKTERAKKLTLTQMANKPREMTRAQITSLSKKMEAAGIYELIGQKPTIPGDWTDPVFKKAYERLMGLAVEQKVSMTSLLSDRTSVYQKSLEDAMATKLTDPARVRRSVDETARTLLGRTLSPEEHAELTQFVHDLERRNARVESGLDREAGNIGGIEDLDEAVLADIDARLTDKIENDNSTEFGAREVQSQYDMFSSFLAGPGRGVS